jgi:hypothetical protein
VDLHARLVGPFTTRPITTFLIQRISEAAALSPWWGFVLAQFFLLTAAAYALGRLGERLMAPPRLSLVAFFLSFTVLFSFVSPNDSYDEAAQYLFLFLGLNALVSAGDFSFALFFFFALLARETSVLLLPGMLLLGWRGWRSSWKFVLPVAAFSLYYFSREASADPNRLYYWARNFQNAKVAWESLVSFGIALALPLALLLSAWRLGLTNARAHGSWIRAFFVSLALNGPAVFATAYARESRLFALPLVFLWPLCGGFVGDTARAWREKRIRCGLSPISIFAAAGLLVALFYYRPGYRFGGYEILAPLYLAMLIAGTLLKKPDK